MNESYTRHFLDEAAELARGLPVDTIDAMVDGLAAVRDGGGRLFILGVGGGAGHASHAVNDFRKLCHLESYAPTDNVSELTARINDDGWETAYAAWLKRLADQRRRRRARVLGRRRLARARRLRRTSSPRSTSRARSGRRSTGSSASPTARRRRVADACVVVPAPAERRTPQVEAFQAVVWHLIVSHPRLAAQAGKWESLDG